MIGSILISGVAAVEMQDDGTYTAVQDRFAPVAEWLNVAYSPKDKQPGDSATPFGTAALSRAARVLDNATVKLAKPVTPIPEGAVN